MNHYLVSFMTKMKFSFRSLSSSFWPYLLLLILTLFYFRHVLILKPNQIIYGGDVNDQFFYWKSFLVTSIKSGVIPFWNPYSFSGTPFLAHPSTAAFYPFNILFFLFPLNYAFTIYLFTHIFLASVFMYYVSAKSFDKLSSLAAGIVFAFSGLFAARIYAGHIDIISSLIWIPLVFRFTRESLLKLSKKSVVLVVLSLVMQILAGYQFIVILTLELIFIYIVLYLLLNFDKKKIIFQLSRVLKIFLLILISFGISAIQLLPTFQFVSHSIRADGLPYNVASWGSASLDSLKLFVSPLIFGNPFPQGYSYTGPAPNYFELIYFIGRLPLIIIIVYLFVSCLRFLRRKSAHLESFYLIIAVIFFAVMSLGSNFGLHRSVYDLLPIYRLFRIPTQHLMMVVFIFSMMVGLAMATVKNIFLKLVLTILITLELFIFNNNYIRLGNIPTRTFDTSLINTISNSKQFFRVLPDYPVVSGVRSSLDFEAYSYYKIPSTSGYNPIILKSYYEFIDLANKSPQSSISYYNVEIPPLSSDSSAVDLLGVKYLMADKVYDLTPIRLNPKYQPVNESPLYSLFKNSSAMDRFFMTDKAAFYKKSEDLHLLLKQNNYDLVNNIYIRQSDSNPPPQSETICGNEKQYAISIQKYSPNSILLNLSTPCSGWLNSSEVFYPGWQAKLDGKPANIYLSNNTFRTVFVPKGEHSLEYFYNPVIYLEGFLISLISFVVFIIIIKTKIMSL